MSCKRMIFGAGGVAILALSGCSTPQQSNLMIDPGMGEAVKYNAALQIIDPDPVYPEGSALPAASGEKGAAAAKRYRTDKVKPVETIRTGSTTSGGGRSQ